MLIKPVELHTGAATVKLLEKFARFLNGTNEADTVELMSDLKRTVRAAREKLDSSRDMQYYEAQLGLRYVSLFNWQLSPPAGWSRSERSISSQWPENGISPFVTFTKSSLPPGKHAMIRWTLLSRPERDDSHQLLSDLIDGELSLDDSTLPGLDAPGLVAGMQLLEAQRIKLAALECALIIKVRIPQWDNEEAVCRYVIVFSDRPLQTGSTVSWFRETLQFSASESLFDSIEPAAISSMKTFKRTLQAESRPQNRRAVATA